MVKPKILFLTTPEQDYLQDTTFFGLRTLLGDRCIEVPRKEVMYRSCRVFDSQLYGRGFTIWKMLEECAVDRSAIAERVRCGEFNLIIFGSINRQVVQVFRMLRPMISSRSRCVFLDGEDLGAWRKKQLLSILGHYYKREQVGFGRLFTRRWSFSIPEEKIEKRETLKTRLFAQHVQCDEMYRIPWVVENCSRSYVFCDEVSYRENLAQSLYGVTMKKGGWDCMRHYEIAANGAVMAFHCLDQKPPYSAPHGLQDMVNVVSFRTAEELMRKIDWIERQGLYAGLRRKSLEWVRQYTCESVAARLLEQELGWSCSKHFEGRTTEGC